MASGHGDRFRDIQRRKEERERKVRKKQIIASRCTAAVFCACIIFLLIFGIKSCVGAISSRRAEKEAQRTLETVMVTSVPTSAPMSADGIDSEFYRNSAFVGNSFVDGMEIYDLIGGADYFARVGLNVRDAMTLTTSSGSVAVIDELKSEKRYNKIFMIFGENELGWQSTDSFKQDYAALIEKARGYQPQAEIYLLAVTPVSEKVSKVGEDGATKENVERFNKLILEVAKEENVNFANVYNAVADERGYLPDDAASDGVHFSREYYKKCLIYLQDVFKN